MINLISDIFAVEIPDDATDIQFHKIRGLSEHCITCYTKEPFEGTWRIDIPGNYTLIGISDEMSEDAAKRIVEREYVPTYDNFCGYDGYKFYQDLDGYCTTAIESFQSLLKSKSLNKRYAILKLNGNGK